MPKYKDLTGRSFGRLTVIRRADDVISIRRAADGSIRKIVKLARWLCYCDPALGGCGGTVTTYGTALKSGRCRSCGCLRVESGKKLGQYWKGRKRNAKA